MCFWYLRKFLKKQRGDPLKNFVPHQTDFDLVTLSTSEKVLHSTEEEVLIFNPLLKKDRLFRRSKRPLKLYYFVI
jgi:hypothetical protein